MWDTSPALVILVITRFLLVAHVSSWSKSIFVFTQFGWLTFGSFENSGMLEFLTKNIFLEQLLERVKLHSWWWLKTHKSSHFFLFPFLVLKSFSLFKFHHHVKVVLSSILLVLWDLLLVFVLFRFRHILYLKELF